jgi:hypothetical protein
MQLHRDAALIALLASLVGWTGIVALDPSAHARILNLGVLAFIPFATLMWRRGIAISSQRIHLAAFIAHLPFLFAAPHFSDDVYRYLWDGRMTLSGIDPYAYAPDDAALRGMRDATWILINHKEIPTIYPALAQMLFALGRALGGASPLIGWKLLLLCMTHALAHVAGRQAVLDESASRSSLVAALVLLQPQLVLETLLDGHIDILAGGGVLLLWQASRASRALPVLGALALAIGTKLVGVLLLPVLFRKHRPLMLAGIALTGLITAPLLHAGYASERDAGALEYARRWEGNAGAYALIEYGFRQALRSPGQGRIEVPGLLALEGSSLHPNAQIPIKKRPPAALVHPHQLARWLSRLLVFAVVLAASLRRGRDADARALRDTLLLVLLLSPQLHPWYVLWCLPIEALFGGFAATVASVLMLSVHAWHGAPPVWAVWVEHLLIALAWGAERATLTRFSEPGATGLDRPTASR